MLQKIQTMIVPSSRTHLRWLPVLVLFLALAHPIFANPGGELCADNPDFRYNGKGKKTCDGWVAEEKQTRCGLEIGSGTRVRDECCDTCGKHGVYDFIIGGMGPSGIGAVYALETIGKMRNYLVLEAKEDMGGKVWATEFGGYTLETAAGYISGGVDNPLFCEMENFVAEGNSFGGYDVQYKLRVNDDDGNKVIGNWPDWDYKWGADTDYEGGMPQTVGERFIRAYYEAEWYGYKCLNQDRYDRLENWQIRRCNNICKINTTEIPSDHEGTEGILDLVVTENNPCDNTGKWDPSKLLSSDLSLTDLMRVDPGPPKKYLDGEDFQRYFAPDDPDGVCVARVVEYIFADKEVGLTPWRTSAGDWFSSRAVFGKGSDFGEERDFIVADDRSYVYLYKRQLARILDTSVNTSDEIVIDEPDRLSFNSKITNIKWDPSGKKDVIITYCKTEKEGQQSYPCVDDERYIRRAKNFISTFTIGILKRSLECERENDNDCPVPLFDPPLSNQDEMLTETLDNLDMATLTKVYLQFNEKFWGNKETYFTPSNSSDYDCDAAPLIYSLDGEEALLGSNIFAIALTGERGKEAATIESSDADTREWVCQEFIPLLNNHFQGGIKNSFGRKVLTCEDIVDIFIPTWINDPLSLGCWLVSPLGSAGKIQYEWPVMGNLILSGEATCERHTGWVPGGYFSGERSTKLMLQERMEGFEDLDTRTLCDYKASKHFDLNKETCHFDLKQE